MFGKNTERKKKRTQPKTNNWRIRIKRSVNLLKEFQRRIDRIILILSIFFPSFLRFLWKIATLWAYQTSKYNFFRSNFKSEKPHYAFFLCVMLHIFCDPKFPPAQRISLSLYTHMKWVTGKERLYNGLIMPSQQKKWNEIEYFAMLCIRSVVCICVKSDRL